MTVVDDREISKSLAYTSKWDDTADWRSFFD